MKIRIAMLVCATPSLLVGGSMSPSDGSAATPTAHYTRIQQAIIDCHIPTQGVDGVEPGDDNTSLVVDTQGDEDYDGATLEDAQCILEATKITDAEKNLIYSTRALDGRQQGSWNGFDATWSYHPNTGLNITLIDGEA